MRQRIRSLFYIVLVAVLGAGTGCTVHTIEESPRPLVTGAPTYSVDGVDPLPAAQPWWAVFDDDTLNRLIAAGLTDNLDILQAVARLAQAQALRKQAGVAGLPEIELTAETDQLWREGEDREQLNRIGAAFTWEIDAFNRLRSISIARQREEQARADDVAAVRLGLSAEIAEAYFDVIGSRNQLRLLNRQIESDRDLLELIELRYNTGLSAVVDVLQQSGQLAEAESLLPPVEAALRVAENRLDVLLGQVPDGNDRVPESAAFIALDRLPFAGVPADLLMNRPDLRALRNELIAADAEIGRAIAERFPQLILDGSFFYLDGPEYDGAAASLLGSLFQPLLDWGARKAEVERNRALYVERLGRYTQAYLRAIEDVENALYRERKQREFLARLNERVRLLERTVEETTERYTNGLTDYLPVLDALKDLQDLQRIIVIQERNLLGFRVQLYRAVGGAVEPPGAGGDEGDGS